MDYKELTLKTGPGRLFNMDEICDPQTLELQIVSDDMIACEARPGKNLRKVVIDFKSQNWHGFEWRHRARIFIPPDCPDKSRVGIIGAKWQDFEPGAVNGILQESGKKTFAEFAEGTALDLAMPIMTFSVPGEDINGLNESDLMGWAMQRMLETGDYTWYSYYPITKAYLRAITLFQEVLEVARIRAVLLGCSKRGASVCIATGVDPERVAGVMTTCYSGGNALYLAALKFAQLGPGIGGPAEDRTGPGFLPASELLKILNNPVGLTALGLFDPYLWRDQIKSRYLVAIGTNDEFFGLGTEHGMQDDFMGDGAFLAIDNLNHTWVSEKHLAAWQMWLAYSFDQRTVPRLEVKSALQDDVLQVQALVDSDFTLEAVTLYYAFNDSSDWRFAFWLPEPMSPAGGSYSAQVDLKPDHGTAFYVEAKDSAGGIVSSLINFV